MQSVTTAGRACTEHDNAGAMRAPAPNTKIKESHMKTLHRIAKPLLALLVVPSLMACANLTQRQQNAAIGAGVGAIGGAVLTGGSTLGTLGGAAIGGVIGHGSDSKR